MKAPFFSSLCRLGWPAVALSSILAAPAHAAPAPPWIPPSITPGVAAMTCTSSGLSSTEDVLVLIDLRDPVGCGANPINVGGGGWVGPASPAAPARHYSNVLWQVGKLGELFGVDVGVGTGSDIYVSALGFKPLGYAIFGGRSYVTANGNLGSGGEVYRIASGTGLPTLLASLPNHKATMAPGFNPNVPFGQQCLNGNSFVGLGQVTFSAKYNTVYVSNLDDGRIYVLDGATANQAAPLCTFDHGVVQLSLPDDPQQLYTQKPRMVCGLEYHPQMDRLFYALRNATDQDEVWSLALDASGCPTGAPCLEFLSAPYLGAASPTFPGDAVNSNGEVSVPMDIQFSPNGCRMLISQLSLYYCNQVVSNVIAGGSPPPAPAVFPANQVVPIRSAHVSVTYECLRSATTACNGSNWNYQNYYRSGIFAWKQGVFANAVTSDYGYGDVTAFGTADSVVQVAEVIRNSVLFTSLRYGLQINPIGDYDRTAMPSGNFDAPLLAATGANAIKFQLNDIDVLHPAPCMKMVATAKCPPAGSSGPPTATIQITNLLPVPAVTLTLGPCNPNQVPPGAVNVTPTPGNIPLPGGVLNPGQTVTATVGLPGLPITGGPACFCAVMTTNDPAFHDCTEVICLSVPDCTPPPCMRVELVDVHCLPASVGGYQVNVTVTNQQPTPVNVINFYACQPGPTVQPIPGSVTLGAPLANGQSCTHTLILPGLPQNGGQVCFCVSLYNYLEGPELCKSRLCIQLPPCPPPCMIVDASDAQCPQQIGGPFTVNVSVTNLTGAPVQAVSFGPCNPAWIPPGSQPVTPSPGTINLNPPLAPNASANFTVSLPGVPCTGGSFCFCVQLLADQGGAGGGILFPICEDMLCVQLPACPCPPCMTLAASGIKCPDGPNGSYSVNLQITNLLNTTAYNAVLQPCQPNQLPPGATTIQPNPAGLIPLNPPNGIGQNQSATLPVTLPMPQAFWATGGTVCFCVALYGQQEGPPLCREKICITLPPCKCATVLNQDVVCVQPGVYQITVTVQNTSGIVGTPFPFQLATFNPTTGFTPSVATPTPNPIAPNGNGTVTTLYAGPPGPKCFGIIFSDIARVRCCEVKVCVNLPECQPAPPPGKCFLRELYMCENGQANPVFYIGNNAPVPLAYSWTVQPVGITGCTGNLPINAFSPSSGTTPPIGPNSFLGIPITVNTGSLSPGQCAAFRICLTPLGIPGAVPVCCLSIIQCPQLSDPCIVIGDAGTPLTPGRTVGVPIIIKNPTATVLDMELVLDESTGSVLWKRSPDASTGGDGSAINDDAPLQITLSPGGSTTVMVFAEFTGSYAIGIPGGGIIVRPPCVKNPNGTGWGHGRILFGPAPPSAPFAVPFDKSLLLNGLATTSDGQPAISLAMQTAPGIPYRLESSPAQFGGSSLFYDVPPLEGITTEPDGFFYGTGDRRDSALPISAADPRQFYRFRMKQRPDMPIPPATIHQ